MKRRQKKAVDERPAKRRRQDRHLFLLELALVDHFLFSVMDADWIVAEMRARAADVDAGMDTALKQWRLTRPADVKKLLPLLERAQSRLYQTKFAAEYALVQVGRCRSFFARP